MSGGVDSSMAAYLLREAGHEVEGLSLVLYETRLGGGSPTACCSLEAIEEAAETARILGIPHSALDARAEFMEKVIEPFVEAYAKGLTPNPCILCNRHIKFPLLLKRAKELGAELIATGHYAKTERLTGLEAPFLKKGTDPKKDQSYVLYALRNEELRRLILPLGGYFKEEIRGMARTLGLQAAKRPESQEICFIKDGKYADFVGSFEADKPGPIVDEEGRTLGVHKGVFRYTVGQRKGLGISSPHPLYVTGIDVKQNTVYVGKTAVFREFAVRQLNWLVPTSGDFRADVKVRSTMEAKPASVHDAGDGVLRVVYDRPQWAPAPGQSAVFYDGDKVIGGGVIFL